MSFFRLISIRYHVLSKSLITSGTCKTLKRGPGRHFNNRTDIISRKVNCQVPYESSKFNFGNLSIVNGEWDTKKDHLDLILKNWSDWNLKNLTEIFFGNWNFDLNRFLQTDKFNSLEWFYNILSAVLNLCSPIYHQNLTRS